MTIYDIAKEAGVAASTVSRVINHKPGIKEETRNKIQEVMNRHNYIPNEAARVLVTQSSKIIGILIEDIRVVHHTYGAHYIEQKLTELGYCCITMSTGPDPEKKAEYIKILEQKRVEGAIFMGSMFEMDCVRESIQEHLSDIPVIIVNGYVDLPNVYGIVVDEENGIEKCTELLAQKGHKKIAYVEEMDTPSNRRKVKGFLNAMGKMSLESENCWRYKTSENTMQTGYEITKKILKEHPDVQGLIFSVDISAVGAINALYDQGIAVPEKVAVVGVDNSLYCEMCRPGLTSLDNRIREMSVEAARILMEALQGKRPPEKIQLFSTIVERKST